LLKRREGRRIYYIPPAAGNKSFGIGGKPFSAGKKPLGVGKKLLRAGGKQLRAGKRPAKPVVLPRADIYPR
jgi:hypothetical protein